LWGNDPNNPIASVAPSQSAIYNATYTPTAAPTNGCGLASGARWISDVANPAGGRTQNYTGNLTDVFSCLALAPGTGGCGEEHQLQAIRLALNPQQINCDPNGQNCTDINMENQGFLRNGQNGDPNAYLAIVFISDEDDCSAQPSDPDGIFLQNNPGDTVSLRCAARGHICNGQPIPDYDPTTGYTGPAPGWSTDFSNCVAKDSDFEGVNGSLPLIKVSDIIASVNGVKSNPQSQIIVAGIIGWPPDSALPGVTVSNQWAMGVDPTWTGLAASDATKIDYLPICQVPAVHSADGNIYKAYGALRHKEFINAFGANGNYYSICNSDFTGPMAQIGNAIAQALKPGCVQYPLIDTDPTWPGVQPECQVSYNTSCNTPGSNGCLANGYTQTTLPECIDPTTGHPLDPTTYPTANIPDSARPCWYLYYDPNTTTGCPNAYMNQRITALGPSGEPPPAGTLLGMKCLTCASESQQCPALGQE